SRLVASYPIDPARVFATGISNGGFMSYRLGCDLADKVAAIAPVAAPGAIAIAPRRTPARPVAGLAIHGTDHPLGPGGGGTVMGSRGEILGAPESIALFARANRCAQAPTTTWEPDRDPSDGTTVQRVVYSGCAAGGAVELLNIEHGGHTWPGGNQY